MSTTAAAIRRPLPKKIPGRSNEARKQDEHALAVHMGQIIRQRRKELGLSQEMLGNKLAITFQQVQKYEKGSNRASGPTLLRMATALQVPVEYFFPRVGDPPPRPDLPSPLLTRIENVAQRLDRLADDVAALLVELRKAQA